MKIDRKQPQRSFPLFFHSFFNWTCRSGAAEQDVIFYIIPVTHIRDKLRNIAFVNCVPQTEDGWYETRTSLIVWLQVDDNCGAARRRENNYAFLCWPRSRVVEWKTDPGNGTLGEEIHISTLLDWME